VGRGVAPRRSKSLLSNRPVRLYHRFLASSGRWSAQMEDFPNWFLRIMVVLGTIGFVSVYSLRHDWSKGWAPRFNAEDYAPPAPPAAPSNNVAPAATAESAQPAAPAAAPSAPAAAPAVGARAYVPCQPIGRTAKGELVYSMDCRNPPQ
jgi:hypothetical protein